MAEGRSRCARNGPSDATHRRAHEPGGRRSRSTSPHRAILQGLQEYGWPIGRNMQIEYRWGAAMPTEPWIRGGIGRARAGCHFDQWATALAPLLQANRSLPIVFTQVPDPVGAGFVNSLAHPGSNATGFITFEYGLSGKWLELLREIAPSVTRAA